MPLTYTRAALVALLGLDDLTDQVRRRRLRALVEDHGFPRALPGLPDTWPAAMVDAWIATSGAAAPVPPGAAAPEPGETPYVLAVRDRLERAISRRGLPS
jgi:hypothetical protein